MNPQVREERNRLDENVRFLRSWLAKPLSVGAVAPSSGRLARAMARAVDPETQGPVVELGPGTGPVTEALLARGVAEDRLVLLEYEAAFCALLEARFPRATVVLGDAYRAGKELAPVLHQPAAAVVSSLPLMARPVQARIQLLRDVLGLMVPGAPFVQFTYAVVPPVPTPLPGVRAEPSGCIWRNLPPARVWTYRQA